jgi:hypothetical protein
MWIGVSRDTFVCSRCRFRLNRRLLYQTHLRVVPSLSFPRHQSTAAAIVEEPEEDEPRPHPERQPAKRHKKRIKRVWKPPQVAELGIKSLGQPAEVLVLKDRDRYVPTATKDEVQPKKSEAKILESLQAENLPLSSEHVRQSIEQIWAPYRNRIASLSPQDRTVLKKKLLNGFTQRQLRSYALERHGNVGSTASSDGKSPNEFEQSKSQAKVKKILFQNQMGKGGIVEYILREKWDIPNPGNERADQNLSISTQKLDYVLRYKQSLLKELSEKFNVAIDVSKADEKLTIIGTTKQVQASIQEVKSVCGVQIKRVRSVSTGDALKRIVSSDLKNLANTNGVMIAWASKYGKVIEDEDFLTISYNPSDSERATNAERAILLSENHALLGRHRKNPLQKISMMIPINDLQPSLVPHVEPKGEEGWSRWVLPQQLAEPEPGLSSGAQYVKISYKLNKDIDVIFKRFSGKLDEFFLKMSTKRNNHIRRTIDSGTIKEEVYVNFGKVLFPKGSSTLKDSFSRRHKAPRTQILNGCDHEPETRLSTELPGVPKFLGSLPPFDEAADDARTFQLRYIPMASEPSSSVEAPTIEVDVVQNRRPGALIAKVKNACAILDEQSHKLLTPAFALDLEFVRRLKRRLTDATKLTETGKKHWITLFEEQARKSSNEFPQFINVTMPLPESSNLTSEDTQAGQLPGSVSAPPTKKRSFVAKEVPYMLASCERVYSSTYKTKSVCLEHLDFEESSGNGSREILRLAYQPMMDPNVCQPTMKKLLERGFKIAAYLSDSHLASLREEITLPKKHRKLLKQKQRGVAEEDLPEKVDDAT